MGVDQPQAGKTGGCKAKGIQVGNKDTLMITQDNHTDFTLSVDQQADLPVKIAGKKRHFAGQIIADQVAVNPADRMRMVKMDSEMDAKQDQRGETGGEPK